MPGEQIEEALAAMADAEFKAFNEKLAKSGYPSYGVRAPDLRKLAKRLYKECPYEELCAYRPVSYEGVVVKGLMIGQITDFDRFTAAWDGYLPAIDSWAQVDLTISSLKIMKKSRDAVFGYYLPLKDHPGEFHKRFFVVMGLVWGLDDAGIDRILNLWAEVPQGQYYVDMAIAWGLATAAVRYYDRAYRAIRDRKFSKFVTNKAIQKSRESFRIAAEQKAELTALKMK